MTAAYKELLHVLDERDINYSTVDRGSEFMVFGKVDQLFLIDV